MSDEKVEYFPVKCREVALSEEQELVGCFVTSHCWYFSFYLNMTGG